MSLCQCAFEIRLSELEQRQVIFLELWGTLDLELASFIRLRISLIACITIPLVGNDSAPLYGVLVRLGPVEGLIDLP